MRAGGRCSGSDGREREESNSCLDGEAEGVEESWETLITGPSTGTVLGGEGEGEAVAKESLSPLPVEDEGIKL